MNSRRSYPPAAFRKIVHYFQRGYSPAFLGNISTEIGYSIESTQDMLQTMERLDHGVRELTRDEKISRNVSPAAVMYEFIEKR